jgi:hypothetical protein
MAADDDKKNSNSGASENEKEGLKISDAVKKIFTAGVTAAFMTEESVRGYLSELKLPKEIVGVLLQSATKTKDEIALRVTNEVLGIIRKIDFVSEISRFAEDHKFRVSAEIEIVKKDKSPTKKT